MESVYTMHALYAGGQRGADEMVTPSSHISHLQTQLTDVAVRREIVLQEKFSGVKYLYPSKIPEYYSEARVMCLYGELVRARVFCAYLTI